MKVNNHGVSVTALFCFYLVLGSYNIITLLISSVIFSIYLTRMYQYVRRSGVKTIYFFLLSMLHTVTSLVLYSCKIFAGADTVHIYYFYFWLMVYLSVLYAFKQDPGFVGARQTKKSKQHMLYCEKCSLIRPVRAWHCRFCDQCVDRYDHHNIWFDQCVGCRNHLSYIVLLVALINLTFSTAWDFFTSSCGVREISSTMVIPNCRPYILQNRSSVLFCVGVFSLVILLVSLVQLLQQIKLITFNLTGFEERRLRRGYPIHDELLNAHYYHSPFSRGAQRNWTAFLLSIRQRILTKDCEGAAPLSPDERPETPP